MGSSKIPYDPRVSAMARRSVGSDRRSFKPRRLARRLALMLLLALGAGMALTASPAEAQAQTASISIQVIHGTPTGGIDASLGSLASQLRSRFPRHSGFQQLASHRVSLTSGSSRSIGLPNGQTMTIRFNGMSGSSYSISVSLPGGGTTVTAPPGGIFFVAGPPYQGGEIIVAIRP